MRFAAVISFFALSLMACLAAPRGAIAQNALLLVDGEPVTTHDVLQRLLYRNLTGAPGRTNDFTARVNALLTNDAGVKEKFKRKMETAQPRTPAEIQKAAARVKKELIEDAMWKVLSEDGVTKNAVIEAVIGDRLKLQTARKYGIEIGDEQVERSILLDRLAAEEVYGVALDIGPYYARREEYGIGRKTLREIMRAELAWRAVVNRVYGPAAGWETYGAFESFARAYLAKLRQLAIVEHRG